MTENLKPCPPSPVEAAARRVAEHSWMTEGEILWPVNDAEFHADLDALANLIGALDKPEQAEQAREWRAQHRLFPGIVVKMSRSCEWQSSINPEYCLQFSDNGGKTWQDAEVKP